MRTLSPITKVLVSLTGLILVHGGFESAHGHQVQASTTEMMWLARELGKPLITVDGFLTGQENPHFADATPTFALAARRADLILAVGADLEIGWLPRTLERAGKSATPTSGHTAFCEVARSLELKGGQKGPVDRSMGHVHSKGNPHFWHSLRQMEQAAQAVRDCLLASLPKDESAQALGKTIESNHQALMARFAGEKDKLTARLSKRGSQVGLVVQMHEDFDYLLDELGLASWGGLEETPGVKPSAGRLAEVAREAKASGAKAFLHTDLDSAERAAKFQELSALPVVRLQSHLRVRDDGSLEDYFEVYWSKAESLLRALEGPLH